MWLLLPFSVTAQHTSLQLSLLNRPLAEFYPGGGNTNRLLSFFYEEGQVDTTCPVTVKLQNGDVKEALRQALEYTAISWSMSDKRIMLVRKQAPSGEKYTVRGSLRGKCWMRLECL